jgi:hypothetical protein
MHRWVGGRMCLGFVECIWKCGEAAGKRAGVEVSVSSHTRAHTHTPHTTRQNGRACRRRGGCTSGWLTGCWSSASSIWAATSRVRGGCLSYHDQSRGGGGGGFGALAPFNQSINQSIIQSSQRLINQSSQRSHHHHRHARLGQAGMAHQCQRQRPHLHQAPH